MQVQIGISDLQTAFQDTTADRVAQPIHVGAGPVQDQAKAHAADT